jgi:MFS family permease
VKDGRERLFTPRFFVMCGFTFTVFLSIFQLLPTAPYRILDLGGGPFAAGLFLGFLTYASALSAPLTGALADRVGKRRMLVACGLAITAFSLAYALVTDYRVMLGLVLLHGVFWSGLLSASSAYMTDIIPEARRAEGIGYWGLSTIVAIAVAPAIGFAVYRHGWIRLCAVTAALNLLMAGIAFGLEERPRAAAPAGAFFTKGLLEWRVLLVSFTLFLYSFGYGGITSFVALYADANHIAPKGIFFTVMSVVILLTRPLSGRAADKLGYKKVLFPSLTLIALGLTLLAASATRPGLVPEVRPL